MDFPISALVLSLFYSPSISFYIYQILTFFCSVVNAYNAFALFAVRFRRLFAFLRDFFVFCAFCVVFAWILIKADWNLSKNKNSCVLYALWKRNKIKKCKKFWLSKNFGRCERLVFFTQIYKNYICAKNYIYAKNYIPFFIYNVFYKHFSSHFFFFIYAQKPAHKKNNKQISLYTFFFYGCFLYIQIFIFLFSYICSYKHFSLYTLSDKWFPPHTIFFFICFFIRQ